MKTHRSLFVTLFVSASLLAGNAFAKQGSTDPLATSNGATNSGGTNSGGTNSGKTTNATFSSTTTTTTTTTTATNPQPFVTATLAFTAVSQVNGSDPVCSGDYHIDPYYPTLSLATVNVDMTGVNAPDGSAYYVRVNGTGGTLYPFTSNVLSVTGGLGLCSYSLYVTPGTAITSVDICDASGQVIASGK